MNRITHLTPVSLFHSLGSTLGDVVKETPKSHYRLNKMTLETHFILSSDLQELEVPSNKLLQLDGKAEPSFLKIKIKVYATED